MARTIVSSKFQVVIPKDVREESGLKKGTDLSRDQQGRRHHPRSRAGLFRS